MRISLLTCVFQQLIQLLWTMIFFETYEIIIFLLIGKNAIAFARNEMCISLLTRVLRQLIQLLWTMILIASHDVISHIACMLVQVGLIGTCPILLCTKNRQTFLSVA